MDRRNFFKIIGVTGAGVATTGCGSKESMMPLLVPEHNIPIGEEQWHPAVCTECAAGCGTLVRIMGAERVIDQKGEKVRQRIAAIKKIEGNPARPDQRRPPLTAREPEPSCRLSTIPTVSAER